MDYGFITVYLGLLSTTKMFELSAAIAGVTASSKRTACTGEIFPFLPVWCLTAHVPHGWLTVMLRVWPVSELSTWYCLHCSCIRGSAGGSVDETKVGGRRAPITSAW
jgi:hypothetical protein